MRLITDINTDINRINSELLSDNCSCILLLAVMLETLKAEKERIEYLYSYLLRKLPLYETTRAQRLVSTIYSADEKLSVKDFPYYMINALVSNANSETLRQILAIQNGVTL